MMVIDFVFTAVVLELNCTNEHYCYASKNSIFRLNIGTYLVASVLVKQWFHALDVKSVVSIISKTSLTVLSSQYSHSTSSVFACWLECLLGFGLLIGGKRSRVISDNIIISYCWRVEDSLYLFSIGSCICILCCICFCWNLNFLIHISGLAGGVDVNELTNLGIVSEPFP